jgi:predicted GIY-YIG superfamily endonuclease
MLRDTLAARLADMGAAPDYQRLVTEVLGIKGASPDLARRLVAQALVVGDRHDAWRRVGQRICGQAPRSPGVYVFRDAEGRALYVGKALNLRRRLAAHFADRRWLALKPALARIDSVEWQEVGSEIEALVREASLIRALDPVVNVQTGVPALRRRLIPRRLVRDVLIVVPSADPDAAELLAARTDGASMIRRTPRSGPLSGALGQSVWEFFQGPAGEASRHDESFAPLIFSWLAGRGRDATRLDPHDAESSADLCLRLETLLKDRQLFTERLALK